MPQHEGWPPSLVQEWAKLYKEELHHPRYENEDYRSLCVGWCLAKGLSPDAAFAFYDAMIPLNLY